MNLDALSFIFKSVFTEIFGTTFQRKPESEMTMETLENVADYMAAVNDNGPIVPLHLYYCSLLFQRLNSGDTVLDLCCGPAAHLITAAKSRPDVSFIGVDLSDTMLAIAKSSKKAFRVPNVTFVKGDIRELTSFGISPNLVMSTMALHHLPTISDLSIVFDQIAKILPPFGSFFIIDFIKPRSKETVIHMVEQSRRTGAGETHLKDYKDSLYAAFSRKEMKNAIEKTNSFYTTYSYSWPLRALQIIEGTRLPDDFMKQRNSLSSDQLEMIDAMKMGFLPTKLKYPRWL